MPTFTEPPSRQLYALLVGINAYAHVRPLTGPLNDVGKMADYLGTLPDFRFNLLTLTDTQATKAAIAAAFRDHLGRATASDTVLFYFSGHGAQEEADRTLWAGEDDGLLECLVCHDGEAENPWDYLLADKELRYLIRKLSETGAHVVTMFDCCHAGDNTRQFDLLSAAFEGTVDERRLSQKGPRRPYEGFLFASELAEEHLRVGGIETLLPEGTHIQLAACESDESALERLGEGIFTKNLLTVLAASHGDVTYRSLHNRVRQYMRFGFQQRPRIRAAGPGSETLLDAGFLNRPKTDGSLYAEVIYNPSEGCLLDVGTIHGVGQTTGSIHLLDEAGQPAYPATPLLIGPDYTVLEVAPDIRALLKSGQMFRARVTGLLTQPVRIHFRHHNGLLVDQPELLNTLTERADSFFVPEDDESRADYTLHVRHGLYFVTRPNDEHRPLLQPVAADDPQAFERLADSLRALSRWQYLRDLRNPEADQPLIDVEVRRESEAPVRLASAHPSPLPVALTERNGVFETTIAIQLTNFQDQPLYCTVLYLSRAFGSFTGFLPTNHRLEPGVPTTLGLARSRLNPADRKPLIRFSLEDVIREYNWPDVTEYFKLLITTDPLSETTLAFLQQDELPSPPTLAKRLRRPGDDNRGAAMTEELDPLPAWSTQTLTLRIVNPLYNKVNPEEISQMLEPVAALDETARMNDTMADFALGLYFEADTGNLLNPSLKLRDELTLLGPADGQRGLWSDLKLAIANQVAHRIRNRQYEQNLIRYPGRLRMVAEGDSWFQYPFLVRDIIDYLSGVYSVYCIAAAGDKLSNYLKKPQFLEAIAQVQPAFFLLSGGGNDVFGDPFVQFLRDVADDTQPAPRRYLTDVMETTLDQLATHFREIFRLVELGYPDVRVLVHGYDYVIPIDTTKQPKKTSWLGKHLIAKGISNQNERETLIRYVVDAFNERLRAVAGEFSHVTYLDLRGTVRRTERLEDYWFDEIHPNDKGFLSVSARFSDEIRRQTKVNERMSE